MSRRCSSRLMAIVCVTVVSACGVQGTKPFVPKPVQDAAPPTSAEVIERLRRLPDPEVKDETPGPRGNRPVYTVWGKSYRVMTSAKGFSEEGLASWYGTKFHGRETSSGERYDIYQLTAAHRHLPLPTYVRVTNLANNLSTIVRVNDRGPFHDDRIIDLSYAAAVKLGFHDKGTSRVRVEVIEAAQDLQSYMVQAGAFSELDRADRSHDELRKLTGFKGVVVKIPSDSLYRLRLGPVPAGEISRIQAMLVKAGYGKPQLIPAVQ